MEFSEGQKQEYYSNSKRLQSLDMRAFSESKPTKSKEYESSFM